MIERDTTVTSISYIIFRIKMRVLYLNVIPMVIDKEAMMPSDARKTTEEFGKDQLTVV